MMTTYNRLDLQTLGSQPIMPKNLPDHCLPLWAFRGNWIEARSTTQFLLLSLLLILLNFFNPDQNMFPTPPKFGKKILPLESWKPLVHKTLIECTSPSRSKVQYICAFPISKWTIDWDFGSKVTLVNKTCD